MKRLQTITKARGGRTSPKGGQVQPDARLPRLRRLSFKQVSGASAPLISLWARQDSNLQPSGYASHHSFRCPFRVRELDYLFTHTSGCLPFSLYTFLIEVRLGSGLPYLAT